MNPNLSCVTSNTELCDNPWSVPMCENVIRGMACVGVNSKRILKKERRQAVLSFIRYFLGVLTLYIIIQLYEEFEPCII